MITDKVIKEIYKKCRKPQSPEEMNIDYFIKKLNEKHHLHLEDDEIIIDDLEEFNPFRRFLKRSLNAILEFDKIIAFVFRNHILFFGKDTELLRVHLRPEEKKSFWSKIFK